MKLSILIPCLNEKDTIQKVLIAVKKAATKFLTDFEIIVADNGSTDGSLKYLKTRKDIKLINVPQIGYGAALHHGILLAKYDYVLFADADLSYDADEIERFISYINKGHDLILGSRFKGNIKNGAMPFTHRFLGTPILTYLIRSIYKINTSDCNSGMRAVKKSFYKKLRMKNSGMEWASELLIKTALKGGKYAEVPINFYKDQRRRKPHLRRWEDGWRHLKIIILLKPSLLILPAFFSFVLGILLIPISLFTTIATFLFGEFLVLSYLVAVELQAIILQSESKISTLLDRLPLLLLGVLTTIFGLLQLFIISDAHLFTKYILFYQAVMFDLWLFFIETIKTHLVNPLPDSSKNATF